MQLSIRHETLYHYTQSQAYSIEQLHLTPRAEPQQQVLSWNIATPGHCAAYVDAYGNASHMLTLNAPHDAVRISRRAKAARPDLPVVWGGWHPSLFGAECLEEHSVDITVQGQGEETFAEILRRLDAGSTLEGCAGCASNGICKVIRSSSSRSTTWRRRSAPARWSKR